MTAWLGGGRRGLVRALWWEHVRNNCSRRKEISVAKHSDILSVALRARKAHRFGKRHMPSNRQRSDDQAGRSGQQALDRSGGRARSFSVRLGAVASCVELKRCVT
jgi:hypothetical protein